MEWYRKAADEEHNEAQFNLGKRYEKGLGVEPDLVQAKHSYRKAADQGHKKAKNALKRLKACGPELTALAEPVSRPAAAQGQPCRFARAIQ